MFHFSKIVSMIVDCSTVECSAQLLLNFSEKTAKIYWLRNDYKYSKICYFCNSLSIFRCFGSLSLWETGDPPEWVAYQISPKWDPKTPKNLIKIKIASRIYELKFLAAVARHRASKHGIFDAVMMSTTHSMGRRCQGQILKRGHPPLKRKCL